MNFTPYKKSSYRIGVSENCEYEEMFNSDGKAYGGDGCLNTEIINLHDIAKENCSSYLSIDIPPYGMIILQKKL